MRIKERYLLVNVLYPEAQSSQTSSGDVPHLLLLNQPTTNNLTPHILSKGIKKQVAELFGDYGAGAVERGLQGENRTSLPRIHDADTIRPQTRLTPRKPTVKYLSNATSTAILRVSRSHYRLLWAALTFMHEVPVRDGRPCVFRVVQVSGTIRKVEEAAIRRAKLLILAAKEQADGGSTDALSALFGGSDGVVDDVVMGDASDAGDDSLGD